MLYLWSWTRSIFSTHDSLLFFGTFTQFYNLSDLKDARNYLTVKHHGKESKNVFFFFNHSISENSVQYLKIKYKGIKPWSSPERGDSVPFELNPDNSRDLLESLPNFAFQQAIRMRITNYVFCGLPWISLIDCLHVLDIFRFIGT